MVVVVIGLIRWERSARSLRSPRHALCYARCARCATLQAPLAQLLADAWASGLDLQDPRVSPLYASAEALRVLPPMLVQVGGSEMLHDQVSALLYTVLYLDGLCIVENLETCSVRTAHGTLAACLSCTTLRWPVCLLRLRLHPVAKRISCNNSNHHRRR